MTVTNIKTSVSYNNVMVDSGGSPESVVAAENPTAGFRRVRMLYHGVNTEHRADMIQKYGLLGQTGIATLASDLSIPSSVARHQLTIWYPRRQDVDGERTSDFQKIKAPLPTETKEKIIEEIEKLDMPEGEKKKLLEMDRNLPADRLGAILAPSAQEKAAAIQFGDSLRRFDYLLRSEGFQLFAANPSALTDSARKVIDGANIQYLAEGLTPDQLAHDMVSSGIEHQLIIASQQLNECLRRLSYSQWRFYSDSLSSIHFANPVYERYRQRLINKYNKAREQRPSRDM
jgi:hypothetical protein